MSRSSKGPDDRARAVPLDVEDIPLIDFSTFLHGSTAQRKEVAARIAAASREIGFFYLAGHGVPHALRSRLFEQSARFYQLPVADRSQAAATRDWYRGWIPMPPTAALSRSSRLFEQYRVQPDYPPLGNERHDRYFRRPNRWPTGMPEFAAACTAYGHAMELLARQLLRAFAIGLSLSEDRFDEYCRQPLWQLSLMYYPPLPDYAGPEVSNTVAHTDEGPLTILAQDETAGLEVKRRDGLWISAPPVEHTYVINIGDMLMNWSNGRYLSNLHRVRNYSTGMRLSAPFFFSPDGDVEVRPLPELLRGGEQPAYSPLQVGEHLARFYAMLERDPRDLDREHLADLHG